ncbi:heterokaryon incompatibility protein-domain-containing protein [Podospora didyma]|uniref:Heterokaryon incompatibility protein-domain-containing protein n=1 Tax=Podospora didyma TaxID=330526 RepID=A0AAE0NXP6_9PEZI|nr:heterokaryon incompatibility protein-domain-containing protein [Podospora didyma]
MTPHLYEFSKKKLPLGPFCRIKLVEVDLDHVAITSTTRKWAAVSYVWGSPTVTNRVLCEGKEIHIPTSAAEVLAALAGPVGTDDGWSLWVDSICINQSSVEERNQQVALMGDLYKAATSTVVWLGPERESWKKSLELCTAVGFVQLWNAGKKATEEGMDVWTPSRVQKILDSSSPAEGRDFLHDPLAHPWPTRLWVVQEMAMARTCYFFHGGTFFPMERLMDGLNILNSELQTDVGHPKASNLMHLMQFAILRNEVRGILRRRRWHSSTQAVWGYQCRGKDDQDYHLGLTGARMQRPKDRAFGLYSIMKLMGLPLAAPNYHTPLGDIYTDNAAAIITWQNSLKIFEELRGRKLPRLPSWVPDLTVRAMPVVGMFPWHAAPYLGEWGFVDPRRAFSSPSSSSDIMSADGRQLALRGRCIGHVMFILPFHFTQPLGGEDTKLFCAIEMTIAWARILETMDTITNSDENTLQWDDVVQPLADTLFYLYANEVGKAELKTPQAVSDLMRNCIRVIGIPLLQALRSVQPNLTSEILAELTTKHMSIVDAALLAVYSTDNLLAAKLKFAIAAMPFYETLLNLFAMDNLALVGTNNVDGLFAATYADTKFRMGQTLVVFDGATVPVIVADCDSPDGTFEIANPIAMRGVMGVDMSGMEVRDYVVV